MVSWPKNTLKDKFLSNLYTSRPDLQNIEIENANLLRNGPSIKINLITDRMPDNPPAKWEDFNRVSIILTYLSILKISITDVKSDGFSTLTIDDRDSEFDVLIEGAFCASFSAEWVLIGEIKPLIYR